MANTASPPAKCGDRPAPLSFLTVVFTVCAALILFADSTVASGSNEPHVRHKRTVSEFVEDLMNAVYFHLDPLPLPSTVIARISHMPPTSSRVSYKYIPMKKMKVAKVRARNLAEPKMKYKYPKKYPTNTEDSAAALTKNDLPWTLHPLPPPLSTSKSSAIEADKNVPWALHPLPPPVKTRNHHEYYWHDHKNRPIKYKNKFKPIKPFHFMNYNPFNSKPMDYKPTVDFKPADFQKLRELESSDFKGEDFNTGDFKSVGYKPELHNDDDDDDRPSDADRDHHEGASSEENMASSKGPGFVATHITIEPSVEIASFSEMELQGDGTTNDAVSHGDRQSKHRCQCIVNGHRHKRQVDSAAPTVVVNSTAVGRPGDARVQRSHDSHPSVGHATEVVIQRSHDITDRAASNGNPVNYVQQLRGGQNTETMSADGKRSSQEQSADGGEKEANSDKFAMNYGREINNWDESRSSGRVTADDDKFSLRLNEDNEGGSIYGGQTDDSYGRSRLGPDADKERRLHLTKSTVDNTGGGVAFSVQTPFSVASFSSNVGRPGSRERQSRFRYTNSGAAPSSSSPFSSDYSEPLDFEQFGLQSAVLGEDKLSEPGQLFAQFSKGFDDRPSSNTGRLISDVSQDFRDKSTDSGRLTTHFSRGLESDRDRSKTFRYGGQTSDGPTGRLIGSRDRPNGSFLEYFQPVVIDFEKSSDDGNKFKSFGGNNDGNGKLRYFGKSDSPFPRFKKHDNPDPLRLPGRLHESNEHLSRKMVFHPSTFDTD